MNKTEILKLFCAVDDDREYLNKPIRRSGYLYASNGHIGIRVPDDAEIDANETNQIHNLSELFECGEVDYHPLPEIPAPVPCSCCNGTGKRYMTKCDECDGTGKIKTSRKTEQPESWEACEECDGMGEARLPQSLTKVGAHAYQNRYLRKIVALPGSRIEHANSLSGAHFIFDGGVGIIMPCKP